MIAKVRGMIDSSSIYIEKKITSGKIPGRILAKFPAIGSASRCRMWGTWSSKNLMKARLGCQSVISVPWAVKKAFAQSEMMCGEHGVTMGTSKSSFLLEELERIISRGYCRGNGPSKTYLCTYWAKGPIRGH